MSVASESLWWLNNTYHAHLAHAEHCLGLLESLLGQRAQSGDDLVDTLLPLLHHLRQQLLWLAQEHRNWRYHYYYQPQSHKRMVATEPEVHRALIHFRRMRVRHERVFAEALSDFVRLPRPGPALTRVALADLWLQVETALDDLARFIDTAAVVDGSG